MRPDLLHLSPEALSQLTNAGLVKRAVREHEAGYVPKLLLAEDATLVATYPDGAVTRWPVGKPISQTQCSCVATGICRHRLIAALQFRAESAATSTLSKTDNTSENTPQTGVAPTCPSQASDQALIALLPASLLAQAEKERDAGLTIQIRRRAAAGEPCDTARLPAATVRFWAGAAIEAARCDCFRQSACEHVALGVWAFRQVAEQAATANNTEVRLGAPLAAVRLDHAPYLDYLTVQLRHGVVGSSAGIAQAMSLARTAALGVGAEWLVQTMADLESWSIAYSARSARYAAETGVDRVTELLLRLKLGAVPGQEAKTILGIGQPREVELDRLRLFCLGARTERDGEARRSRLVLADQDTGTLMALFHDWRVPETPATAMKPLLAEEIFQREQQQRAYERLAPGIKLEQLAVGQLLARQARRFADGRIALARARSTQNSLLAQSGDWESLSRPLRYTKVADLRHERPRHPLIQARQAAGRFVVFSPTAITDAFYDPHLQSVQCVAIDADDTPLLISRSHATHTRHALEKFAAAISARHGPIRHISGVLSWQGDLPTLDPWTIVSDTVLSLDFSGICPGDIEALASLPLGHAMEQTGNPLLTVLLDVKNQLARLLHYGTDTLPLVWQADCRTVAARLHRLGWPALGEALVALVDVVLEQHTTEHVGQLAKRFSYLAMLRQLYEDALAQGAVELGQ